MDHPPSPHARCRCCFGTCGRGIPCAWLESSHGGISLVPPGNKTYLARLGILTSHSCDPARNRPVPWRRNLACASAECSKARCRGLLARSGLNLDQRTGSLSFSGFLIFEDQPPFTVTAQCLGRSPFSTLYWVQETSRFATKYGGAKWRPRGPTTGRAPSKECSFHRNGLASDKGGRNTSRGEIPHKTAATRTVGPGSGSAG